MKNRERAGVRPYTYIYMWGCGKRRTREGQGGEREVFMNGNPGRRDVGVRIFLGANEEGMWIGV